jgi:signal transduction histidine kinase
MSLSIRTRLILAMNLLVAGVAAIVGWAGVEVSSRVIERRLVDEPAANASELFSTMRLPFTDAMMARLAGVLDLEVAVGPADRPGLVASSLPPGAAGSLRESLSHGRPPRRLMLAGTAYFVGRAETDVPDLGHPGGAPMMLYVLAPAAQVQAAQWAAGRTIVLVTLAAVVVATLLAVWLSATILRPVRHLAARMDALAQREAAGTLTGGEDAAEAAAPPELARLSASFEHLLARLAHARAELARSARLATLGQLAASVAHELRNPLSGIKMNARVLADEMAARGIQDSGLDRIVRETDRMSLYLSELLDLASGDARPPRPLDPAALPCVRLDETAESVLTLVEHRCRHAGVDVRRAWPPLPPVVRADETALRQVVLNLVLNALDAMPAGGVLTLSAGPGQGGTVRLAVADTGGGVHPPPGADVFEPFVTTKSGGVGLGLYVCRRNIERHGGRLGYDSSDGGTTFWFDLPAAG